MGWARRRARPTSCFPKEVPPIRVRGATRQPGVRRQRLSAAVPYLLVPVVFFIGGALIDGFISRWSILALLVLGSMLGIASVGQTLTILLGGIDLSIPAVMGMANVLATELYGRGWPFGGVIAFVLVLALLIGAVNGLLSRLLRAHPLVITLATGSAILGGVLVYTSGVVTGSVPDWLNELVSPIAHTGPIPLPGIVVAWIVITVVVIVLQRYTTLGRQLYALGASPRAAEYALVRPLLLWPVVFALSSFFAAVTGILLAGFSGAANAAVGQPYLFLTIATVVVGGTSLLGGRGGYGRTVAGTLLIVELTTILIGLGAGEVIQQILLGVLIILMVALYGREPHIRMQI